MFQTKVVGKIKAHILFSVTFFLKSCCLWDNVGKFRRVRKARDDKIWRMRFACCITNATDAHARFHNIQHFLLFHGKSFRECAWILRLFADCLSFWMLWRWYHIFTPAHVAMSRFCQHLAYGHTGRDTMLWYQCCKTRRHFRSVTAVLSTFRPAGTQQVASLKGYKLYWHFNTS